MPRRPTHFSRAIPSRPFASSPAAEVIAIGARQNPLQRWFQIIGPGFITGASDDDPSGIATYAQAGASLGFSILWTALFTFPLMWGVQYICAKIAMVTRGGLAGVLRRHYSKWLLYPLVLLLAIANTINAGADLGAIAAGINLLVPVPLRLTIPLVAVSLLALQTWGTYRLIAATFKWLALALVAYIVSAFLSHPDWKSVLAGTFTPSFRADRAYLMALVAIFGTTLSPYLFFWQADQEIEEQLSDPRSSVSRRRNPRIAELNRANWDVAAGMFFSNLVMYFIILATAATLFRAGPSQIQSATEAAQALRPLAGRAAYVLFAVGLVGSGFLSVPILTGSAAYAVAEALRRKRGLDQAPRNAKLFYGVIFASTAAGMAMNFTGINPMAALWWAAIVNGIIAPPILLVILCVANNRSILRDQVNGLALNLAGWLAAAVLFAAAIALLVASFSSSNA